jgi:hypothetical protein
MQGSSALTTNRPTKEATCNECIYVDESVSIPNSRLDNEGSIMIQN